MIVTVASFKGGVGKTTTALHLAAYCQTLAPTLLVDGDLNTRATIYLPKKLHKQIKTAAIVEEREMSDIVAEAINLYFTGI